MRKRKLKEAFGYSMTALHDYQDKGTWEQYIHALDLVCTSAYVIGGAEADQAWDLIKKASAIATSDSSKERSLAVIYFHLGQYVADFTLKIDSAIHLLKRAKELRKKYVGEITTEVALCEYGLGTIYQFKKYDFIQAEEHYEWSLEILEKIKAVDRHLLARIYYTLATANRAQGELEQAKVYCNKTLEVVKNLGEDTFEEVCYNMLGLLSDDLGDRKEAGRLFAKAIEVHKNAGPKRRDHTNLVDYYSNLGTLMTEQNQFDKSLGFFNEGLNVLISDNRLVSGEAFDILGKIGGVLSLQGDATRAEQYFYRSRKIIDQLDLSGEDVSNFWSEVGDHHVRLNRLDSALMDYHRSVLAGVENWRARNPLEVPSLKLIKSNYYLFTSFWKKASVLKSLAMSNHDPAYFSAALKSIILAEQLMIQGRNSMDREDSKWKFSSSAAGVYEEAIALIHDWYAVQPADTLLRHAFFFFERSKAKSLSDALARAEAKEKVGVPDSLLKMIENGKSAFFSFQSKLETEAASPHPDAEKIKVYQGELFRLERDYKRQSGYLEQTYPEYSQLKFITKVAALKEVSAFSTREGTEVLEFFWGKKNVYSMRIDGSLINLNKIGPADSIAIQTGRLASHFAQQDSPDESFRLFVENAANLYALLLSLQGHDPIKGKLLIIPDGPLYRVPFECLLTQKPPVATRDYKHLPYLINRSEINYGYLASSFMTEKLTSRLNHDLLAFGYEGGMKTSPSDRGALLAGVGQETRKIASIFSSSKKFEGDDATETNFKANAPAFGLIHLAIHGKSDATDPSSASLFFKSDPQRGEDGVLHSFEMYNLRLNARLTVLSACESGIGRVQPGEGVMSMAYAFSYSGCPTVVMSLWKVSDFASVLLMSDFYHDLQESAPLGSALRHAKMNYLDQADEWTADPAFWAAYVVYGDVRPVRFKQPLYLLLLPALLFIGVFYFLARRYFLRKP